MTDITLSEVQEYYPLTDSLSQGKINLVAKSVKNNTFLQMFGLSISNRIFDGTIPNSDDENFIGFRKFIALCIVGQLVEDSFIHTNAGLKMVSNTNWTTPKVNEKTNPLNKINTTIESQFIEAKRVLCDLGEISKNKYAGYASFKIEKI
jgi:hypothetical protein